MAKTTQLTTQQTTKDKQGGNRLFDELKRKSADELKEQLIALRREGFNLRFRQAQGQLEAPHAVRVARRQIARIKTLLAQRDAETSGETSGETTIEAKKD